MIRRGRQAVTFDVLDTLINHPSTRLEPEQLVQQAAGGDLVIDAQDIVVVLPKVNEIFETRVESEPSFARGINAGKRKYWEEWYKILLDLLGINISVDHYASVMFDEYLFVEGFTLNPDAKDVLSQLRSQSFGLGLISNASERLKELLLREGLLEFVEVVVISDEVGIEKPDLRIFQIALDWLSVPSSMAYHVGDSWEADVVGARNAGMWPIWYNPNGIDFDVGCPQIRSLKELPDLLERLTPDV